MNHNFFLHEYFCENPDKCMRLQILLLEAENRIRILFVYD